jgi:hypothetical protein
LENVIAPNKNGIEFRINFDSHKFTRKFIDTLVKDAEDEYEKPEWGPQTGTKRYTENNR